MTKEEIIHKVFDGTCLLFVGSGFSFGATNCNEEDHKIKGAGALAKLLLKKAGCNSDTEDLRKASSAFLKRKSEEELISILKSEFQVSSISPAHDYIGKQNWFRLYTTNYDDILEVSYNKSHKSLTPISLGDKYVPNKDYSKICVHLNGYINNLKPELLNNEFKLTTASYLTNDFENSDWVDVFRSDIIAADAVIFIGFSMDYDLDLARIIVSSEIKDKTLFVVRPGEDELNIETLSDFGTVLDLGLEGFVKILESEDKKYDRNNIKPFCPISFKKIQIERNAPIIRDKDFYSLILNGEIDDHLAYHSLINHTKYPYLVNRTKVNECLEIIKNGSHSILVESALGNGKTVFLKELSLFLVKKGYDVFEYTKYSSKVISELHEIQKLFPNAIVIFDDYHSVRDVVKSLRKIDSSFCIVTSERKSLHEVIYDEIEDVLGEDYNVVKIDKLDDVEIQSIDNILDHYSLWGQLTASRDRIQYIHRDCHKEICNIVLSRIKSPYLTGKIEDTISTISKNPTFANAFKFLLIAECFHIPVTISDFGMWVGMDLVNKPSFRQNENIKEYIDIENSVIHFKSSIVARYILTNMYSPHEVIDILIQLVKQLNLHSKAFQNKNRLITFVNFTTIQSCLNSNHHSWQSEIFRFYETVKDLSFCSNNIDFWLQYAIARLYAHDYPISKTLFDKCYSLAEVNKSYQTYKIDNHYCRFLLENEIKNGTSGTCMEAFRHAHEILSNTHIGDEKKHYPYKVAALYEKFYAKFKNALSEKDMSEFKTSCWEMAEKCNSYIDSDNCTNKAIVKSTLTKLQEIIAS